MSNVYVCVYLCVRVCVCVDRKVIQNKMVGVKTYPFLNTQNGINKQVRKTAGEYENI